MDPKKLLGNVLDGSDFDLRAAIARQLGASRVVGAVPPGRACAKPPASRAALARPVRPGSACRLAAFPPTRLPAGRPPGHGADRGVGLQQGPRCPGRRIAALGG